MMNFRQLFDFRGMKNENGFRICLSFIKFLYVNNNIVLILQKLSCKLI